MPESLAVKDSDILPVLKRANTSRPAPADVQALRKVLSDHPAMFADFGDAMSHARNRYLDSIEINAIEREAIRLQIETLRKDLSRESDGTFERMLIDHVLLCWLRLAMIERDYTSRTGEGVTLAMGLFLERRLSQAQKRFLRSAESLAKIRKLTQPRKAKLNIAMIDASKDRNLVSWGLNFLAQALIEKVETKPHKS